MQSELDSILKHRPAILDGAMGTVLQARGIVTACNEEVCLSRPEIIRGIHFEYLKAGSDIILTNTFGASSVSLEDHGLADKAVGINAAAAKIAREAADSAKSPKRFVAGDIGPTSKLPTLSHISFDDLFAAYAGQIGVLVDGGVDMLLVETCQDPLQAKAAVAAAKSVLEDRGRSVPILVSVTVEKGGAMLLGTELAAALTAISPYRPMAFGINCATGPEDMKEHLRFLSGESPFHIICEPNAGMPDIEGGRAVYRMEPRVFGEVLADYARQFGLSFIGGCCGTTPDHIASLVHNLRAIKRASPRTRKLRPQVSSLFTAISLDQEPRPFLVAEQTNVNGSRKFRDLLQDDDFKAMAEVAKRAAAGSHALDICLATPGRDEPADFVNLMRAIVLKTDSAVMIDSTSPGAIEAALKHIPGRAIINSINLEDGGDKARDVLRLAQKYGAATVGLVIDEDGMARTCERKVEIALRLVDLVGSFGMSLDDIFIDMLTFTLTSGDRALCDSASETLRAIKEGKKRIKGLRTILGVSNVSYGLSPKARKVLTSVFLGRALEIGLDAAIVNPARIVPLHGISKGIGDLCARLIHNDRGKGDPLSELLKSFDAGGAPETISAKSSGQDLSPEEALRNRVLEGNRDGLVKIIDGALSSGRRPSDIISGILLPAMQEVGARFGDGKLPLPFVLESAETMRAAIDLITPHMKADECRDRGVIVLATVRGDVHDIGKNLVDAILSNNGFRVINLGIRQPAAAIIEAALANDADAIGLSGLLVSSTEVMREDLAAFRQGGLSMPVLCGGAALTSSFVKKALEPEYGSKVFYCRDAFAGLGAMEEIISQTGV